MAHVTIASCHSTSLFLCFSTEVLRTWETTSLKGTFERDTLGGGICASWANAGVSGGEAGLMHFLLCFYGAAIVE